MVKPSDPAKLRTERSVSPEEIISSCEPPPGLGSCILANPEFAEMVQSALLFFEDKKYSLISWCLMPNHVHIILAPWFNQGLSKILHSIKSFSANQINKGLHRTGAFWERESFDHLIRSPAHLDKFIRYVENNPVQAGLCRSPQEWPFGSRGQGFHPKILPEIIDPRKNPFSPMASRGELPHLEKESGVYFVTFRQYDAIHRDL